MPIEISRLVYGYAAFHSIRLLNGSFHVVFLLLNGISIPQIAVLQIVYAASVVLFEFPLGLIGDRIGKKPMVVFSCVCMAFFFITLSISTNFIVLIGVEIVFALGLASISGSFEGWVQDICNFYKIDFTKIAYNWTFYFGLLGVIFALIGYIIASLITDLSIVYLIIGALFLLPMLLFLITPSDFLRVKSNKNQNSVSYHFKSLKICFSQPRYLRYLSITVVLTCLMQIIFHLN